MKRGIVSVSTGCMMPEFKGSINKVIEKYSELDIGGVELLLGIKKLASQRLSRQSIRFLRKLEFNTIHAPMSVIMNKKRMYYYDNPATKKFLDKIYNIYNKINACNINFHIHCIKSYKLLANQKYTYSIENNFRGRNTRMEEYTKALNKNPHLKFVLDTTHAVSYSKNHINKFTKNFKDRIIYYHLSARENSTDHLPLCSVSKQALRLLNPVRQFKRPVVLEYFSPNPDINLMKKEIKFVRAWLKN